MKRTYTTALAMALLGAPGVSGTQSTSTATPAFDVASIKESPSVSLDGYFRRNPGRFTVENLPLRSIIQYAYRLREYQLFGAPAWISRTYDISATFTNSTAGDDDIRVMLQNLLADRFSLRVHREQRSLPLYALVIARPDGALGPKLVRSDVDCDKVAAEPLGQSAGASGPQATQCIMFATTSFVRGFTRTMAPFAQTLEQFVRTPVSDRTGLTGNFNIDVRWASSNRSSGELSNATVEDVAALFTAIQEQLGLKLEPTRGPVDIVVIDSIQRPTPN